MLDIKFVRDNPDAVKENIKKKFQDAKLPLVDEVIEKDAKYRECLKEVESLKAARNKLSKANGPLFGQLKKCDDEAKKAELQAQIDANNAAVKADADKMAELEAEEAKLAERIQEIMYTIPQMIDPSVPIGPDDTYNVEAQRFGEPVVPDFPIPYHTEIMESFDGIDMDAAGRVAGNGFYYLLGNIARLHEAVLAYARDFMIDKGFTYVIPPFMMHGNVVQGVMSFPEMDAMMYKIEGEDLYLIGTSEHTMIGRFIDQTLDEATLQPERTGQTDHGDVFCLLVAYQHLCLNAIVVKGHRLEVNTPVGTAVITRSHHVDHRIVIIIATEWSIDTHMVIICLDSLVDFAFFHLCDLSELSNRRFALVLLLKLTDFCTNLTQCTYLVQRQANDTALLGNSLQDALTNPPYGV